MTNGLRFLDCGLVVVTGLFVIAGGLPLFGYAIAATAWLVTRAIGLWLDARAATAPDPRTASGLMFANMMVRLWIMIAAVVTAGAAGGHDDGAMAAALSLAAFTVYFVMHGIILRPTPRRGAMG